MPSTPSLLLLLSTSQLSRALRLPDIFANPRFSAKAVASEENGVDPDNYPWRFDGRVWFRPALVRAPTEPLPAGVSAVSLFGWTVGGVVALEYDESPVGPYREYVTMGAVVSKRGALGQWGSRLFVSTKQAEEVCVRVWDVPAEVRTIEFAEDGRGLCVEAPPALEASDEALRPGPIRVSGWAATRSTTKADAPLRGGIPIMWTPSIKALWAPLVPLPPPPAGDSAAADSLPTHGLRLSASSLRLHLCGQASSTELGVPLPIGLSVDDVRIEISREREEVL